MAQSLTRISKAIQEDFVEMVRSTFGDDLVSIVVYGSYLKETFTPGVSDVNILVVLSRIEPAGLERFGRTAGSFIRRYRITPLILSRHEFVTSADVFPMEYLDIVENHRTIHGTDATEEMVISRAHLRHEIEHQLRGNLLSLRQLAVASGRPGLFKKRALRKELEQWYGSLSAILRAVLRLYGVTSIPSDPRELVAEVNTQVKLEPGPILQLLECREGNCGEIRALMEKLILRLEELIGTVDTLESDS